MCNNDVGYIIDTIYSDFEEVGKFTCSKVSFPVEFMYVTLIMCPNNVIEIQYKDNVVFAAKEGNFYDNLNAVLQFSKLVKAEWLSKVNDIKRMDTEGLLNYLINHNKDNTITITNNKVAFYHDTFLCRFEEPTLFESLTEACLMFIK